VTAVRFAAAARQEFLPEVEYYQGVDASLARRFSRTVAERT
jgi:hypothetical protein